MATHEQRRMPSEYLVYKLGTKPVVEEVIPFLTNLMEQHDGCVIQDTDQCIGSITGLPVYRTTATWFLFPAGTKSRNIPLNTFSPRSEILFPDGYRLYAIVVGTAIELLFPVDDIPPAYQQHIKTYVSNPDNQEEEATP